MSTRIIVKMLRAAKIQVKEPRNAPVTIPIRTPIKVIIRVPTKMIATVPIKVPHKHQTPRNH